MTELAERDGSVYYIYGSRIARVYKESHCKPMLVDLIKREPKVEEWLEFHRYWIGLSFTYQGWGRLWHYHKESLAYLKEHEEIDVVRQVFAKIYEEANPYFSAGRRPESATKVNEWKKALRVQRFREGRISSNRQRRSFLMGTGRNGAFSSPSENEALIACAICTEDTGDNVFTMPNCRHRFHVKCVDGWSNVSAVPSCPLCRASYNPLL